jgi:hypothetical protein
MAQPGGTLGKPPHHYRCWNIYVTKTNAERIGDTVEFFPQHGTMPTLSSRDTAIKAAIQLTDALQNPHPAGPFAPLDTSTLSALEHLSELFHPKSRTRSPINQPRHLRGWRPASPRLLRGCRWHRQYPPGHCTDTPLATVIVPSQYKRWY